MDFFGCTDKQLNKFKEEGVYVCCKGVKYDFTADISYDTAWELARNDVKEMYYANQQEELDEREEMLNAGDISDYSEYIGDYLDEYDENRYLFKIEEVANTYMRNLYDISDKVVLHYSYEEAQALEDEDVRKAISDRFGVNVTWQGVYDVAKPTEVLAQKSFDAIHRAIEGSDYKTFLNLKSNLENYSYNNISLVYAQRPTAEVVKGFKVWNTFDRSVCKGEKAIQILAPNFKMLHNEEEVEKYAKQYYLSEKEKERLLEKVKEKGETQVLTYYSPTYVFDISQTEPTSEKGKDIEQLIRLNKPLKGSMENYRDVVDAIEGITVYDRPCLVSASTEKAEQERLFEAIKAYADTLFAESPEKITGIKTHIPMKGNSHKMEVAISAYLVCKHIGIECEDKLALSMTDVMEHLDTDVMRVGKRNMFQTAFDRASAFAKEFNGEFDKKFGEISKEAVASKETQKKVKQAQNER